MFNFRKVIAVLIGLSGAVFFAQGTGLFTSVPSFMNYNYNWAVIGVVMVIAAFILWPRSK